MGLLDGGLLGGGGGILPSLPLLPSIPLPSLPGLPTIPLLPTGGTSSSAPASASSVPLSVSSSASAASLPTSSPNSVSSSVTAVSSPPASSFTPTSTSNSVSVSTGLSTDNNGNVYTVSTVVTETASGAATTSAAPAHHESFLENKPLSGTIFALSGLVALVLIVVLVTWVFRRRRRDRLLDDAVSFDPSLLAATTEQYDASEKGHSSNASLGTLGSGRPYGPTYQADPYNPYGARQQYGGPPPQQAYYGAPQPAQQPEYYYGGAAQQPYYSGYVPPMTDAPPPALAATTSAPRATHTIPRVPVPPQPLPKEFGSSEPDRTSIEESEFWAKTLKVTNAND
ncbi:hypothetical protein B0H12DRAFT_1227431 [Mycena haematopus]|nr:hypothetical protein B0H12DRAFT_1227431 [Mycena haematopus]